LVKKNTSKIQTQTQQRSSIGKAAQFAFCQSTSDI